MERRILNKINNYVELSLYILAFVCFVYFLYHGNRPKMIQPLFIIVTLIAFRTILKKTRIEFIPILKLFVFVFIFVAMFLAVEFSFYSFVWELDKFEHFSSGILLVFVGFLILKHINRDEDKIQLNTMTVVGFSLFFAVSCPGCWEIFEYSVDKFFHLATQNGSLEDTMQDIICGTTGAIITSIYLYNRICCNDKRFLINKNQGNIANNKIS